MKLSKAELFWIGLAGYVTLADLVLWRTDHNTMSGQFTKWCETDKGKVICIVGSGYLMGHLFLGFPLLPLPDSVVEFLAGKKEQ